MVEKPLNTRSLLFILGLVMISTGAAFVSGFHLGVNDSVTDLENQMENNTINRIENINNTNYTVACTSSRTNIKSNYVCLGMIEEGAGKFNIIYKAECSKPDNKDCQFDYWDRGNFLFSQ
jgi:hypothetical protein